MHLILSIFRCLQSRMLTNAFNVFFVNINFGVDYVFQSFHAFTTIECNFLCQYISKALLRQTQFKHKPGIFTISRCTNTFFYKLLTRTRYWKQADSYCCIKKNCDSRIFLYTLEIQKILNWVNLDELDNMDACIN